MNIFIVEYAHRKIESVFRNSCIEVKQRTFVFLGTRKDAQILWDRAIYFSDSKSGFYWVQIDPKTHTQKIVRHGRMSPTWRIDDEDGVPSVIRTSGGHAVREVRAEDLI